MMPPIIANAMGAQKPSRQIGISARLAAAAVNMIGRVRCKRLETVELENIETHERRTVHTPAVFSMIGAKPRADWLPPEIETR